MSIAITSSPNRAPRVLKRWLIAISSSAVASVTVIRTYWWEFCRARVPRSKTSAAWSFNLAASSGIVEWVSLLPSIKSGTKLRKETPLKKIGEFLVAVGFGL